ncbi:hypothetical protein PCL_08749 [Purpureocillium lilacinum]|uniref:Uncharacterized protein n=1 Tax=Purpureocillium lilacinum TaxID=33203 RepID=A0A2U3EG66_PURLI|nr:hypothetical protein Purlil1_7138 [Purpureocillium lilacinum]PWI73473.1 hypothetical protein PCL_08749 [Purpureocillium lilacinum]
MPREPGHHLAPHWRRASGRWRPGPTPPSPGSHRPIAGGFAVLGGGWFGRHVTHSGTHPASHGRGQTRHGQSGNGRARALRFFTAAGLPFGARGRGHAHARFVCPPFGVYGVERIRSFDDGIPLRPPARPAHQGRPAKLAPVGAPPILLMVRLSRHKSPPAMVWSASTRQWSESHDGQLAPRRLQL